MAMGPTRLLLTLGLTATLLSAPAVAQDAAPAAGSPAPAPAASPQRQERLEEIQARKAQKDRIDKAVAQLVAEARDLDQLIESKNPPVYKRPHPLVKLLQPDDALPVLVEMQSGKTGNKYLDTYINWHLMEVVKNAKASDLEEAGRQLVKLIQQMPGPVQVEGKQEYRHEPPEAYAEWSKRYYSLRKVVGYPPYQEYVYPPKSLELMSAAERAAGDKTWAEAQEWRSKFTTITDPLAVAFNRRIREMNQALRDYRGELVYQLLRTTDPAMLKLVIQEMERQCNTKTGFQFDLLNYMYLAAFDGVLSGYKHADLKEASQLLERIARKEDAWVEYGRMQRNFADYAFHMIFMMRDEQGFIDPQALEPDPSIKAHRGRRVEF